VTQIFEQTFADVVDMAVQFRSPNESWDRLNGFAELCLALPYCLFRGLELFNIQIHPDPLQQGPIARPEWFGATEEPAVVSLRAPNSETHLASLARAQTG
jgi:hypothetical protein